MLKSNQPRRVGRAVLKRKEGDRAPDLCHPSNQSTPQVWYGFDAVEYRLENRLCAAASQIHTLGRSERIKRKSVF